MPPNTATVGPLSPRYRLRRLDGRTREAKVLRETEAQLFAHVGGRDRATAPQRYLIERVAADLLRLSLYDVKLADGTASDHDLRVQHALRNSVRLALRDLGLESPTAAAGTHFASAARAASQGAT